MKQTQKITLEFKWTVSRGRDTAGYTVCTLYADGIKVARCNGGGYDMKGTNLGNWLTSAYADRLLKLHPRQMEEQKEWRPADPQRRFCRCDTALKYTYDLKCSKCGEPTIPDSRDGQHVITGRAFCGLRYYDPTYDALDAKLERADGTFTTDEDVGKTYRQLKKAGKIVDLDVLRSWYAETSRHPTKRHTVPTIDGACGFSSVERIARAIGITLEAVRTRGKNLDVYIAHVTPRKARNVNQERPVVCK